MLPLLQIPVNLITFVFSIFIIYNYYFLWLWFLSKVGFCAKSWHEKDEQFFLDLEYETIYQHFHPLNHVNDKQFDFSKMFLSGLILALRAELYGRCFNEHSLELYTGQHRNIMSSVYFCIFNS